MTRRKWLTVYYDFYTLYMQSNPKFTGFQDHFLDSLLDKIVKYVQAKCIIMRLENISQNNTHRVK